MEHSSCCMKRKRGERRSFKLKSFCQQGYPVEFVGSFGQNVKALLEFGHLERKLFNGMPSWSFQLQVHRHPPLHVLLFVVEEAIEVSLNRHCKHCQYVGWGHNLICNKKYHFVVPSKDAAHLSCEGYHATKGKFDLVDLQAYIMHGVFHANGFGHLLWVNGVEMGSDLPGHKIMGFWDRLCAGLRARKVSLNDISQKSGMELRLLHGVAHGEPWFSSWGYKFGRGSFGVTQAMYEKAIEAIQGMPLYLIIHHLGTSCNHEIQLILSRYQLLSDHSLVTLRDLFRFMLELKCRLPKETSGLDSYNSAGILLESTCCRWSPKRVEMATRVIVESLRRVEFRWISRQEVRDAARAYIGDTGLLDFVLKSLGNHIVGNYLVRRTLNPVTKVLEYCLQDISNVLPHHLDSQKFMARYKITRAQLMSDMSYLYKCILMEQKLASPPTTDMFTAITLAARIILDTKYLSKDYYGEVMPRKAYVGPEDDKSEALYCTVLLRNNDTEAHDQVVLNKSTILPPFECVLLKDDATMDELYLEVQKTFGEMYWGFNNLVVKSIVNLNAEGSDAVFSLTETGCKLVFDGVIDTTQDNIYETSENDRVVHCFCGAKDDDGERMVSCDICEVRQHTRCVQIPNNEEIPHIFVCNRCEQDIILFPSLP